MLASAHDLGGQQLGRDLAQDSLRTAEPNLARARKRRDLPDQIQIEVRHARLERREHAHLVDLREQVALQPAARVRVQCGVDGSVAAMRLDLAAQQRLVRQRARRHEAVAEQLAARGVAEQRRAQRRQRQPQPVDAEALGQHERQVAAHVAAEHLVRAFAAQDDFHVAARGAAHGVGRHDRVVGERLVERPHDVGELGERLLGGHTDLVMVRLERTRDAPREADLVDRGVSEAHREGRERRL